MKILKVRIINSHLPSYWYAKDIGKTFYVVERHMENWLIEDSQYEAILPGEFHEEPIRSFINKKDVEIIEEFDGEVVCTIEIRRNDERG